ncbi:MAG: hypothetical protein KAI24_25170 [Planctomycetes bacterium]|nr:hypothetical protein [Planctomycetota bacterium]
MTRPQPPLTFSRLCCGLALAVAAPVGAQSFQDLVDSRNAAQPYSSIFQLEFGAIGAHAEGRDSSNALRGLESDISWDGKVYYRDESFGSRRGTLEAYAGRDGIFAGFTDGKLIGDDTLTRLEFHARPWMFYRDGFYQADELRQNGFYEGSDYEAYLGFGREAQDGLYIEFGPFYRRLDFQRSDLTSITYTIPEDYTAYGGRLYLEQRAVQMDRRRGLPQQGFVLTLIGEREWNDANRAFGTALNSTRLPDAVWRARGRLEWYIPASDLVTWEVFATGGAQDEKDRVYNFEGQRPIGHQWADAQVRLRWLAGSAVTLTPFAHLQYSRVASEDGFSSSSEVFFGGGVEGWLHFGDAVSLHSYYSYINNENRPSIRIDEDIRGDHMFYLGMVLRLGASRR